MWASLKAWGTAGLYIAGGILTASLGTVILKNVIKKV